MNKTLLIFLMFVKIIPEEKNLGFIITPVADLISSPKKLTYDNNVLIQFPLSPFDKKDEFSCPRIHQLLFNDPVKILKTNKNYYLIEVPHFFYEVGNQKINTFWINSNDVMTLKLKEKELDVNNIPKSVSFKRKNNFDFNEKVITLIIPYFDNLTQKKYSAGTKFIYTDFKDNCYKVKIFDPKDFQFKDVLINKKYCISKKQRNIGQKISCFIKLLKKWANLKNGFIPYVWGGTSFCHICNDEDFSETKINVNNKILNYYSYKSFNFNPKTGFDCSGLICMAAQICHIPFFFKNSTTIANNLKSLERNEEIENGDLIWIPGHVIVISDINNNLCIEATDYSKGYGKVHEIHLSKIFDKINNFDDLKMKYFNKATLERKHKNGKIIQRIPNFKILKLKSVLYWNNQD